MNRKGLMRKKDLKKVKNVPQKKFKMKFYTNIN